jgi:predicted  nucleic acid-binding Zn-ribbon protein
MTNDSEAAGERVVSVEGDGVRVEKTFEKDEFPVPVVSFRLSSTADDSVELRLTDNIPESFEMEHVGFHPDFDSEDWTAYRDHRVEFVCTLDPDEELRTVYGVRLDDDQSAEDFLGEPTIERRDETSDSDPDDVLGRETNQLVRDALAGEDVPGVDGSLESGDGDVAAAIGEPSDGVDQTDAGRTDDSPTADEPLDLDDDQSAEESDETRPEPREVDADLSPATSPSADDETPEDALVESVAAALAAELRAGNVDDDDVETLREHLDVAESTVPKSVDVRLRRLQSTVADLDAYSDALEEFLDENGTGEELVDGFREDVQTLEDELAAVEDDVDSLRRTQTSLREDVDDLDSRVDDRIEGVESSIADERAALEDDLDSLRSDVEADIGAVDDDVAALSDRLDALESEVSETEAAEAEEFESLASDVEALEDDLDELREFRERMKNAFGE